MLINTASIAGYEGTIGTVAYASAKGGVIGMTIAAARDLAVVGIRVVTIAPGTFLTPAYGMDPDAVEAYWAPAIPFPKRMGRPDEYARLVQAICENPYLNGEVIRIDAAIRFGPKSPDEGGHAPDSVGRSGKRRTDPFPQERHHRIREGIVAITGDHVGGAVHVHDRRPSGSWTGGRRPLRPSPRR